MNKMMLLAAAGVFALASCQEKSGYTIKGTSEGIKDGEVVYLQDMVDGELVKLDSAVVTQGAFEFKGTPDSVTVSRYVTYMKDNLRLLSMVFLENGNIQVHLERGNNKVSGTLCNDAYQQFMDKYIAMNKEMNQIYRTMRTDSTLTDDQLKEMEAQLTQKDSLNNVMVCETVEANIGNLMGVQLLATYADAFELDKVKELLGKIPASYTNNPEILQLKERVEILSKTAVGQKYTDFSMNTPEGETVKLSDFVSKNKYTLIDFWASWCGPCRKEMPNVVAAYKAYQAKGFGIVGVSLDNDAEAWKRAIKDLNITWAQMSDLKGWACEGAKLYGVRAIPATVLVDQEGTIIARDLRGDDIAAKLAELLK